MNNEVKVAFQELETAVAESLSASRELDAATEARGKAEVCVSFASDKVHRLNERRREAVAKLMVAMAAAAPNGPAHLCMMQNEFGSMCGDTAAVRVAKPNGSETFLCRRHHNNLTIADGLTITPLADEKSAPRGREFI